MLLVRAFIACSLSSVLYPLALFDKIKVSDLVDFFIKQVLRNVLSPPSLEATGAGKQELSLSPASRTKGRARPHFCPCWSELVSLSPQSSGTPSALAMGLGASPES